MSLAFDENTRMSSGSTTIVAPERGLSVMPLSLIVPFASHALYSLSVEALNAAHSSAGGGCALFTHALS